MRIDKTILIACWAVTAASWFVIGMVVGLYLM